MNTDDKDKTLIIAVAALLMASDAQRKLYERDRWRSKIKDALWPLL